MPATSTFAFVTVASRTRRTASLTTGCLFRTPCSTLRALWAALSQPGSFRTAHTGSLMPPMHSRFSRSRMSRLLSPAVTGRTASRSHASGPSSSSRSGSCSSCEMPSVHSFQSSAQREQRAHGYSAASPVYHMCLSYLCDQTFPSSFACLWGGASSHLAALAASHGALVSSAVLLRAMPPYAHWSSTTQCTLRMLLSFCSSGRRHISESSGFSMLK